MSMHLLSYIVVFMPLAGSLVAGLFSRQVGRAGAHTVTIVGVSLSFIAALLLAGQIFTTGIEALNFNLYTWASGENFFPYSFHIGFLIDRLTVMMMLIVSCISLLVHIYSIGYMADDEGYQRFFSYISLFTFMMMMLVTANNFLQLFFGWEGVGLVSYLLIGFWYDRESALEGSLKAFLVNRVGDFGFILGLGLLLAYCGSLDYTTIFKQASVLANEEISLRFLPECSVLTLTCLLLFFGAMAKSAQVPLHVWLPESMEGPTPISALIHAATMVTAGVFMVARLSPLMELSQSALSFILVIGATGALFTGILALVMNDIKRVVAYSTLSQLGYMMVAMGISAYGAGLFHLLTHAFFKALLFLGAGSVIIAMHHEQDMRKMGGLWQKMPITYVTYLIGSLALCAIPPFAGFYSKDTIIELTKLASVPGANYAYFCVLIGAMVTALYTFRSLFMTFHGKPRMSASDFSHVKESPWVVWLPLVILALPSTLIGYLLYEPMLFDSPNLLSGSIFVLPVHDHLVELGKETHSAFHLALESITSMTFWLTLIGIGLATLAYLLRPELPGRLVAHCSLLYRVLVNKYGFDIFYEKFFVRGTKFLGSIFYNLGDLKLIDGFFVNGTGLFLSFCSLKGRTVQSGYLYHYVAMMLLGLFGFLCWLLLG